MKKVEKTGNIAISDPVLAVHNPGSVLGSVSENFAASLKKYSESNPDKILKDKVKAPNAKITKKTLNALLELKYLKSVVEPGEALGVVAAQSVGEPVSSFPCIFFPLRALQLYHDLSRKPGRQC